MKTRIISLMLILFMAFGYIGCSSGGGSGSSDPVTPVVNITTGITGSVTDMEGVALEGVTIYAEGNTVQTDKDGSFAISTSASAAVSLTAQLDNYARNSKVVAVEDGSVTTQNIKLSKVDIIESFDATSGATLQAKDAKVDLPINAYTLDDGTPYSGEVTAKATYNRVTTVDGSDAFSGDFLGETVEGDTKVLQSYGFIDVTLESDSGANLQLASGATATLTYPMDPTISETPATIPLWYFDTQKGIWVEDGVATYDATTNTYVGQVTHFSTWNLDAKFDGAELEGCVVDAGGDPVPLAEIFVSTSGWNNSANHTITNNDATGSFKLINAPSNVPMNIIAKVGDLSSSEYNVTLQPNKTTTMPSCLVVDVNASELFTTVKAKVVDGDNNPLSGQYIQLYSVKDSAVAYMAGEWTDSNGEFSATVKQSDFNDIELKTNYQNINFEKTYLVSDKKQSSLDLGLMVLATTTINGCVTLENGAVTDDDGNTTLGDGTLLIDGTTIGSDGFTQFGSDLRVVLQDSPYSSYELTFDQNGLFSIVIPKDNELHTLYAHTYTVKDSDVVVYQPEKEYVLTGSMQVLGSQKALTLQKADECIQLHKMKVATQTASASIDSSNNNVHLEVSFAQSSSSHWGENILENDTLKSATFAISQNGVYDIKQAINDWNTPTLLSGTMSVTVNGDTHTITIPSDSTENPEWWTAFSIESYDGTINIKDINSAW